MMKSSNTEILTWTALLVAFRRSCQHLAFDFRAVLRQKRASKAGHGLGLCHDICHCTATRCQGEAYGGFRCDCYVCDPFFALRRLELMARDTRFAAV